MSQGRLLHIHTVARSGRPMVSQQTATAIADLGLDGDRYAKAQGKYSRSPGARDVTLFAAEIFKRLKDEHGLELLPQDHRRNLTTEGTSLSELIGRQFTIGAATFEGLRPCSPCRYLNLMSKKQISARLTDQAGIYCRVVSGGTISVGDPILVD